MSIRCNPEASVMPAGLVETHEQLNCNCIPVQTMAADCIRHLLQLSITAGNYSFQLQLLVITLPGKRA